ncbi:DUF4426 domain-containing protein [Vibrio sp. WXL103]|uniref:DUF4426 domain-containing protein n=1 Tax=Vibrio sp. WXL103 TaxID=3450710 RepID=UPI003EC4AD12
MKYALLLCLSALFSMPTWAGQFKTFKDVEVHYSAFNSTFLTPAIARSYDLKRNGYSAILNISVLDKGSLGKPATTAQLSGSSKNLIGNSRTLTFREVREGDAIYYLAEFPITNEETLTFNIDVDSGSKGSGRLTFTQKFYVDN